MTRAELYAMKLEGVHDHIKVEWYEDYAPAREEVKGLSVGEFREWLLSHGENTPYYDSVLESRKFDVEDINDTRVLLDFY